MRSLGLFVQDGSTPSPFPLPACGVPLVAHNGGVQGYATMMYSTLDGGRTLTASLTYVDDVAMTQAPRRRDLLLSRRARRTATTAMSSACSLALGAGRP